MYKIKQIPEDFIVNEIIDNKLNENGSYSYFVLKKRDYATPAAVEKIAYFLNIPIKRIGYAGVKDRRAVTKQVISIEGLPDKAKQFKAADIELEYLGRSNEPIYLGKLKGNEFEIIIRNIRSKPKKITKFLNLFDEQRFSSNNVEIGKAIVNKNFRKAVEVLINSNGYYERLVREYYEKTNDAVNSLRKIQNHVLLFFVHAYQSELWNRCALMLKTKKNIDLPIIGFGTETKNKEIQKVIDKILKEENITTRDFIIKSMPDLTSEGNSRKLYADVKDLKIGKLEKDELNKGMKKIKISFFLHKGNYATMAIKNMFK